MIQRRLRGVTPGLIHRPRRTEPARIHVDDPRSRPRIPQPVSGNHVSSHHARNPAFLGTAGLGVAARWNRAGRKTMAVLAREGGWSRDTVRRRLESWRHNGDLTAEQVRTQRRTAMPMPAALAAPPDPASLPPPSPPAESDSASSPEPD